MSNIHKIVLSVLGTSLFFITLMYANVDMKTKSDIIKVRGKIITDDNITVANTQKVYKLTFLGDLYDKRRIVKLLNEINREIPIDIQSTLKRYLRDRDEKYKVILYGLTKNDVEKIQKILDSKGSKGFSFVLSGERRIYPYGYFLTPVLGYNKKQIDTTTNFTYLEGVTGVEKEYNRVLADTPLVRAKDVHLSIDFKRQRSLEKEVYELKALYDAKEVISVVMDDTFHIKAFASSNCYKPNDIHRKDFTNLDVHAIQYLFAPNEFTALMEDTVFYLNAKNPEYHIHVNLEHIKPSGIDLSYERVYKNKLNFMQLVEAYSPFYMGGYVGSPKLVKTQETDKKQIISQELAQNLKKKADMFFSTMPGKRVTLEFEDNNISADIYMKSFVQENQHYMKAYFTIYKEEKNPFDVVVKSEASSSHQYIEATIYSKKDNHKIGKVLQPINMYQANRRKDSERDIVSVYKSSNGKYYIDTITTKGAPSASCNACQTYNVETFEVTENKLISKGLRSFDTDSYTPYNGKK